MILKTLIVGMYGTNCYIVASDSTKKGLIIDPGADSQAIMNEVNKLNLKIEWIVLTHTHFDHVGAVKDIKDATGAKIAMHEREGDGVNQALAQALGALMSGSLKMPFKPDIILHDGDVVSVDDLEFTVIHTPGHSPGGLCLAGHGILFSGDTLFNCGIGRTDFPGCSHQELIDSIRKKLFLLSDDTVVYPGHGPHTTIGSERRTNAFIY